MSKAKITLYGFYQYFINKEQNLFTLLNLPDGIDKTTFSDSLLMRAGEFEVIYSDPDFMRDAIGVWGKKWYRTFKKWIDALSIDYAPLENYDRKENWVENESYEEGETTSETGSTESSGTTESDIGTENKVSAYDSNVYQPESQTGTNSEVNTSDNVATETQGERSRESDRRNVREGRAHGNIGVTTSQQMLQSELDLQKWNIYEKMSDIFITEFLIPVYE